MRRLAYILVGLIVVVAGGAGLAGKLLTPYFLRPPRRASDSLVEAERRLSQIGATKLDFDVRAADGVVLRGWKVLAPSPNGDWVLLYHGITDNRAGMLGHAIFLLRRGYSVIMMDSRAQGESGGEIATYGWKERYDTVAITNALYNGAQVRHLYALGVSMGAAIALQSCAVEPRISAVVAEDPFANLREISYDYAGLRISPFLGETLFRLGSIVALRELSRAGGFNADDVSPEKSIAQRSFPALLLCGTSDNHIPCRHAERIAKVAKGPVELWVVQGGQHASALGQEPAEYEKRIVSFFEKYPTGPG